MNLNRNVELRLLACGVFVFEGLNTALVGLAQSVQPHGAEPYPGSLCV